MSDLNTVAFTGRMVRDPELRTTASGDSVANFTLAAGKRFKAKNSDGPDADFFRVTAWRQTADYVTEYGAKGRRVFVSGRLESRKYTDKDGNNREAIEIVADQVGFLDYVEDGSGGGGGGGRSQPPPSQANRQQTTRQPSRQAPSSDEYDPFADE